MLFWPIMKMTHILEQTCDGSSELCVLSGFG